MKNILKILLLITLLSSCTISKSVRETRNSINGHWKLENIRYENNTTALKSKFFEDAADVCFEGSEWFFRNNNSTGMYTIQNGSLCQGGGRDIRWSVIEREGYPTSQLQFKFIDENKRDITQRVGYRLDIAELSNQEMTLKSDINVEGEKINVIYEFKRMVK